MPLTDTGRTVVAAAIAKGFGGGSLLNLYFGIGDGDQEFSTDQVDLQGANKLRRPLLSGYPMVAGSEVRCVADFEAGTGTFDIKEYGLFDAPTGGTMLLRMLVSDLGNIYPQHTLRPSIVLTVQLVPA
jgi:hypothetical protein